MATVVYFVFYAPQRYGQIKYETKKGIGPNKEDLDVRVEEMTNKIFYILTVYSNKFITHHNHLMKWDEFRTDGLLLK